MRALLMRGRGVRPARSPPGFLPESSLYIMYVYYLALWPRGQMMFILQFLSNRIQLLFSRVVVRSKGEKLLSHAFADVERLDELADAFLRHFVVGARQGF